MIHFRVFFLLLFCSLAFSQSRNFPEFAEIFNITGFQIDPFVFEKLTPLPFTRPKYHHPESLPPFAGSETKWKVDHFSQNNNDKINNNNIKSWMHDFHLNKMKPVHFILFVLVVAVITFVASFFIFKVCVACYRKIKEKKRRCNERNIRNQTQKRFLKL